MPDQSNDRGGLSIGAVSKATGIPAGTLRTWERRYGFPDPKRNASGHRVYDPSVVQHLHLIDWVIDAGHRPSNVVGLSEDALLELMGQEPRRPQASNAPASAPSEANDSSDDNGVLGGTCSPGRPQTLSEASTPGPLDTLETASDWLDEWLEAVRELKGEKLDRIWHTAWNRMGGLQFLTRRVAPFLEAIGYGWRDGTIGIVQEHYVSHRLRDFLSGKWRPMSDRSQGLKAICATPPDEGHALGLHMAALVLAMAGWRIGFLGPDTPLDEVHHATRLESVAGVFLSMSARQPPEERRNAVAALRDRLGADLDLVVGGAGAPRGLEGVRTFDDLGDFFDWANEQPERAR